MGIEGMQGFDAAAMEAAAGSVIAMMLSSVMLIVFILLFNRIVFGIFCKKLAGRKGYKGYFWTGFFFGLIGLIYVIGLPDMNIRKDMRAVMKRLVAVSDRAGGMGNNEQAMY